MFYGSAAVHFRTLLFEIIVGLLNCLILLSNKIPIAQITQKAMALNFLWFDYVEMIIY